MSKYGTEPNERDAIRSPSACPDAQSHLDVRALATALKEWTERS
ncbi:hypothetical protein [Streptomyces sp. NPDC005407]